MSPLFKDSREAVDYGTIADGDQLTELKRVRKEAMETVEEYKKQGLYERAFILSCQTGYYREAILAAQGRYHMPPLPGKG